MFSTRPSTDSIQGYSPLLSSQVEAPRPAWLNSTRRRQILIGVPCLLVLSLIVGVVTYLGQHGAFEHVTRDVRIVNGTVIEPNTKLSFAVNRRTTLDGQPRVQRLIGVFLKTRHVPEIEATLHVFVEAAYVDRAQARKELAAYKSGPPHAHQDTAEFEKFIDVLANGKTTVTYEYRMVMSPPGSYMLDNWLGALVDLWKKWSVPAENIPKLRQCFLDWFDKKGFHNHDDDFFEVNSKNRYTSAVANGKRLQPAECTDPMFGKAIIEHELYENGHLVVDLLPTLWNTEYDEDF